MPQMWFPVKNKVQTMFPLILIPEKNTRELRNNVNPTSKKLKKITFFLIYFLGSDKYPSKSGTKTIHHEPVHVD